MDDGGGPVVGSITLLGANVGTPVLCTNFDDTGVLAWRWELIDVPEPSVTYNPIPPPTFGPSETFTPDVKGHTILVRLTTYSDVGASVIDGVDQKAIRVRFDPPFDWIIPAAHEKIEGDALRGWAVEVNELLRDVQAFMAAPPGSGIPATLYDADTILKADVDDTPVALVVPTNTVLGRLGAAIAATAIAMQSLLLRGSGDLHSAAVGQGQLVGRTEGTDLSSYNARDLQSYLLSQSVANASGGIITRGQATRSDASGSVLLAKADTDADAQFIGAVRDSFILPAVNGLIQLDGTITVPVALQLGGAWAGGDKIYLSDATAGSYTNVAPTSTGSFIVRVGRCWNSPGGGDASVVLEKTEPEEIT
jgi:hypothetical protein